MTTTKYYHIFTFGCQMNESDTEKIAGQLESLGYISTDNYEEADIIFLNTCCVRESAELKIYGRIGALKKLKTIKPDLIIGVAGCMAQKDREKLLKKAPHIDLVIGTHNLYELGKLITQVLETKESIMAVIDSNERIDAGDVPTLRKNKISAWVPIMYGCNNFCTYCIVPYVRGREKSRPISDIVAEIQGLANEGFKEVTLLGQNVNSYGKDFRDRTTFASLLKEVDAIKGIERIRYMTSHPRDMNSEVIQTVKNSEHICEQFHLPVQSGSNRVLKAMNRGYTVEYYEELVKEIRTLMPKASLTTDLIVGFPGETEEMFEETYEFLKKTRYDMVYMFLYNVRSGTPAATMPNQIPIEVKKDRFQKLADLQNQISLEINKTRIGDVVEVLVEGTSKNDENTLMGRTSGNKIVLWDDNGAKVGDIIKLRIDHAQTWLFKGTPI